MLQTFKKMISAVKYRDGINQAEIAKRIGVKPTYLSDMLNGRVPITESVTDKMMGLFPYLSTPDSQTQTISGDNNIATMGAHNKINVTRQTSEPKPQISYSSGRPYYNVDFLGGFDQLTNDQTTTPEYSIDFAPYNRSDVVWCNITGDSMEPRISSGDIIAIRPIHDWGVFLEYGKIYAIVTTNDIRTVKKVRKGSDKDHLLLVPENLDKYDEQEIQKTAIRHIFEVLGCIRKL